MTRRLVTALKTALSVAPMARFTIRKQIVACSIRNRRPKFFAALDITMIIISMRVCASVTHAVQSALTMTVTTIVVWPTLIIALSVTAGIIT